MSRSFTHLATAPSTPNYPSEISLPSPSPSTSPPAQRCSKRLKASSSTYASSSASTPRPCQKRLALPSSPPPSTSPPPPASDSETYVVARILARSAERAWTDDGLFEHQYLVRWEGYGPGDDTWEGRANFREGAWRMVEAFERRDHPFEILESRSTTPRQYLVRYGHPSPLNELLWHTASQIKKRGSGSGRHDDGCRIAPAAVDEAVRAFHRLSGGGGYPSPSGSRSPAPRPVKGKGKGRSAERVEDEPMRCLAILACETLRSGQVKYHVRYRLGRAIRLGWVDAADLDAVFEGRSLAAARKSWEGMLKRTSTGPRSGGAKAEDQDNGGAAVKEEEEGPAASPGDQGEGSAQKAKGKAAQSLILSEYELERQRNIAENQELLRSLGLGGL